MAGDEDAGLLGAVRCLEKGAAVQEIDGKQKAKLLTIFMNMTRSRKYNEQPTFVA